jgi:Cu(I)/Ag(I) efflux system periplasmic protein CusF
MIKLFAVALVASLFSLTVVADDKHHKSEAGASQGSAQTSAMVEGEIRKVDKDAKKITIKHGPLEKLDMPAMTMVFQVKDPAMLDQVKPGDKVIFEAEKIDGAFTVTEIQRAAR